MKAITITTLFFLFAATLATAQSADTTLSFATENVPEFKRQTILEEFQVPYEQDVERKRLLRLGIQSEAAYATRFSSFFTDFHQKVGKQNSLLIGVALGNGSADRIAVYSKFEFRRFVGMKSRIEGKTQKNNFNGNYFGISFMNGRHILTSDTGFSSTKLGIFLNSRNLQNRNIYSVVYGTQLGGLFDFALQAGVKEMKPAYIDNEGLIIHEDPTKGYKFSPFIGTRASLSYSFKDKGGSLNCDFINCFREVNSVWKFTVNDLFYVDFQQADININAAYEKRIGKSSFSSNSNFMISGGLRTRFTPTGNSVKIIRNPTGFYDEQLTVPTYLSTREIIGNGTLRYVQDIKYYLFQKREITRAKTVQNLNGFYIKGSAALNLGRNELDLFEKKNMNKQFFQEFGLGLGLQKLIGSKYFMDYSATFYPITNNSSGDNFGSTFYLKLNFGLVKQRK